MLLCTLTTARAASPWSVLVRATYVATADKSDAFSALEIDFPAGAISTNDEFIPEIDIAYAFSDTLSAELVLTIPQELDVSLAGVGGLGSFKYLPPTLFMQYHANPEGRFRPYVGAGLNFTLIWDENLVVAGVPLTLEGSSFGLAAQLGLDWKIDDRWAFNLDLKYAQISSKVFAGSTALTEAQLDPWLYSVGFRYSF